MPLTRISTLESNGFQPLASSMFTSYSKASSSYCVGLKLLIVLFILFSFPIGFSRWAPAALASRFWVFFGSQACFLVHLRRLLGCQLLFQLASTSIVYRPHKVAKNLTCFAFILVRRQQEAAYRKVSFNFCLGLRIFSFALLFFLERLNIQLLPARIISSLRRMIKLLRAYPGFTEVFIQKRCKLAAFFGGLIPPLFG